MGRKNTLKVPEAYSLNQTECRLQFSKAITKCFFNSKEKSKTKLRSAHAISLFLCHTRSRTCLLTCSLASARPWVTHLPCPRPQGLGAVPPTRKAWGCLPAFVPAVPLACCACSASVTLGFLSFTCHRREVFPDYPRPSCLSIPAAQSSSRIAPLPFLQSAQVDLKFLSLRPLTDPTSLTLNESVSHDSRDLVSSACASPEPSSVPGPCAHCVRLGE